MALFRSHMMTAASGSVGGLTFLPSRGGMTLRARAIPVNPSTPFQNVIRTALAYLASYWVETLSAADRDNWETYALNTPRSNALGERINIGGIAAFLHAQIPRIQAGLLFNPTAPTAFNRSSFTAITPIAILAGTQRFRFTFDVTDDWVTSLQSAMLVFISPPRNASVRAFRGRYRLAGSVIGNPLLPPTSPVNIPLPFRAETGQRLFTRVAVTRLDGRYTLSQTEDLIVT